MKKQETTGWILLALTIGALLWLLKSGSEVLHGAVTINFLDADPLTGAPQFSGDADQPGGIPVPALPPAAASGPLSTWNCPAQYQLWKKKPTGQYLCFPEAGD